MTKLKLSTVDKLSTSTIDKINFLQCPRFHQSYRWGRRVFSALSGAGETQHFSMFIELMLDTQQQSRAFELSAGPHTVAGHGDGRRGWGALGVAKKASIDQV